MDITKFRVWDRTNKKMVYPYENADEALIFNFYANGNWELIKVTANSRLEEWIVRKDNGDLLQYTGEKDKNNNDIYEGDILLLDAWDRSQQVRFIEGAFCLADKEGDFTGDIHYIHHAEIPQAKVIGNIFENFNRLE